MRPIQRSGCTILSRLHVRKCQLDNKFRFNLPEPKGRASERDGGCSLHARLSPSPPPLPRSVPTGRCPSVYVYSDDATVPSPVVQSVNLWVESGTTCNAVTLTFVLSCKNMGPCFTGGNSHGHSMAHLSRRWTKKQGGTVERWPS